MAATHEYTQGSELSPEAWASARNRIQMTRDFLASGQWRSTPLPSLACRLTDERLDFGPQGSVMALDRAQPPAWYSTVTFCLGNDVEPVVDLLQRCALLILQQAGATAGTTISIRSEGSQEGWQLAWDVVCRATVLPDGVAQNYLDAALEDGRLVVTARGCPDAESALLMLASGLEVPVPVGSPNGVSWFF